MFDNFDTMDPAEAEASMRKKAPGALPDDEHIIMAFKLRNYKLMFTPFRIITKDSSILNKSAHEYTSLPYRNVAAYSICTAGALDSDTELYVYSKNTADKISLISKEFKKDKVDLFAIMHLLNHYVLRSQDPFCIGIPDEMLGANLPKPEEPAQQGIRDLLGDNAAELDAEVVEKQFKDFLVPNEKVRIAYKSGRDLTAFTTKRVILVDKKGITGKSVEYKSILYSHIRMFSVETAAGGIFDRDADLHLYTDIPELSIIKQDVKKDCNILKLHTFLTDVICGVGGGRQVVSSEANTSDLGGGNYRKSLPKFLAGEGDAGQIDARSANTVFHEDPSNILQNDEIVEMAFKGRKDYMLFTTKRIVFVDNKTVVFAGKKVNYLTIPYFAISHFAIQTPGNGLIFKDRDAELQLWTDSCNFQHQVHTDDGTKPPEPLNSFIEQDLATGKVDLLAVHRYLSYMLLSLTQQPICGENLHTGLANLPLIPVRPEVPDEDNVWSVLSEMFSDNAHQVDAVDMNAKFHANNMLQADETVGLAFANGRDLFMLTTKRIFMMDTKGMTGKKVQYISVPFSSVRSFGVCTASSFDRDCEFFIDVKGFWNTQNSPSLDCSISSRITQDLSKGKCDVMAIHNFMSDRCVLNFADQTSFTQDIPSFLPFTATGNTGAAEKFISFFDRDNLSMLSSEEIVELNQQLRCQPPLLLSENVEHIELGFKKKKDLMLFTNLRLLHVDRKKVMMGVMGEKMEYSSIPWPTVQGFGFQAAGSWGDSDSEMMIYRDVSKDGEYKFDLKKGCANQNVINRWLDNKIMYKM